ncbi:hypothetical protein PC9H_001559 [Pleurotus ostreatus]|uniref:Uncharacterized protein n=2 Tax=Pleurotus ostreatus TaxID=5322 RepID=A0A8H7AAP3_PLEOS|nr:uncharacterized protein PC9H_001559 [Pleurotus ostreatus]KAF7441210.1 hypothetical protein PC9H_001559 [Pleurotus ostreatus]
MARTIQSGIDGLSNDDVPNPGFQYAADSVNGSEGEGREGEGDGVCSGETIQGDEREHAPGMRAQGKSPTITGAAIDALSSSPMEGLYDVDAAILRGPKCSCRAQRQKERTKSHKSAKRAEKRQQKEVSANAGLKAVALKRRLEQHRQNVGIDAGEFPHASSGFIGSRRRPISAEKEGRSLEELVELGFKYIPWTGESLGIFDAAGRLVAGGGTPRGDGWKDVAAGCAEVIENTRSKCTFQPNQLNHRRGRFPALAVGISYGFGQPRPMRLQNAPNTKVLNELMQNPDVKRVAGFQSHQLRLLAPALAQDYRNTMDRLTQSQPELVRNFTNSDYAAFTVNFGPRTVSIPHTDCANLAYGLCAVTALGNFDPDKGGHLILWDLQVVIRFPPGATLLIPSALVQHSNLPIQNGERRYSVTQYSAGGLFRWVRNGLCSDAHRLPNVDIGAEWENGLEKLKRTDQ